MPSLIVKQWVRLNETDFGNEFILNKNALFFYEIVHGWKNSIDTFICRRLYYKYRLVVFAYLTREFEMKLFWRKIHECKGNWLWNGWMNSLIFSAKMFQMQWNSSSNNQLNQTWQQQSISQDKGHCDFTELKKKGSESASPNPTSPWPCPRWTARAPRSPRSPTHKWRSGRSFYKVESSVRTAYITQVWEEFQSNFTHSKNMKHNKILMTSQIHLSFESSSKLYFWLKPEIMERFRR